MVSFATDKTILVSINYGIKPNNHGNDIHPPAITILFEVNIFRQLHLCFIIC